MKPTKPLTPSHLSLSNPIVITGSSGIHDRRIQTEFPPHNFAPGSPTDTMMSPCSMKLFRKRSANALPANRKYTLEADVPRKRCPLPRGMSLILGSSSKNRKEILDLIGWEYSTMSPDIDEKAIRSEDFLELPVLIATAKAEAILNRLEMEKHSDEQFVLLTCDQVVLYKGALREKPESVAEAEEFLSSYSNDSVSTVSAVVATHFPSGRTASEVDIATVHWKEIPRSTIDAMIAEGEIFHCSGGFQVEHPLMNVCVKSIEGTMDSVVGMPVSATCRAILKVTDEDTTLDYIVGK